MVKRWIGQLALYYCREILYVQYQAAVINQNTLRGGRTGLMTESEALTTVESSLGLQIAALEALINLPNG